MSLPAADRTSLQTRCDPSELSRVMPVSVIKGSASRLPCCRTGVVPAKPDSAAC